MNDGLETLLKALSDGRRSSGTSLAERLAISRAAVWKRIEALRDLGVDVPAQRGGGYRLTRPIDWLDGEWIRRSLRHRDIDVEIRFLVESTNARLADQAATTRPRVLIAEGQTGGRGRRGRGWVSPPGGGVYLSLGYGFESGLTGLAALSLVAGAAGATALRGFGVPAELKWPNDLVVEDRKLGGCLIELGGSADGPCRAVLGLGINVWLGESPAIDQPWTDLVRLGFTIDRNALAVSLIDELIDAVEQLERDGFGAFASRWPALDALAGRRIVVHEADGRRRRGQADGIDGQGRLRLIENGQLKRITGGEVSVRRA
jgi:BirA family biotin operon repressor/biotin-[acetyl-CoA-carboxylase] ligase